jgi:hypothetical protein
MRFALRVHSSSDTWGADVAVVSLNAHDRECILKRHAALLGLKAYDSDLQCMEFSDWSVEWYELNPAEEQYDELEDIDVVRDFTGSVHGETASVECVHMVVTEGGIHWRCWTKHGDVLLYTSTISWALLEEKK